jgi:hypothetical protein
LNDEDSGIRIRSLWGKIGDEEDVHILGLPPVFSNVVECEILFYDISKAVIRKTILIFKWGIFGSF